MTEQEKLMRKIQVCDFALFEAALFLDTHKNDAEALKYYRKHRDTAKELREEYTKKFGPLKISDSSAQTKWEWVEGPWPWEYDSSSNGK